MRPAIYFKTLEGLRVLPDKLRRNVPDLLIATVSAIFSQYKKAKVGMAMTATTSASGVQNLHQVARYNCIVKYSLLSSQLTTHFGWL